jgi:hypothetical protein
MAKKIAAAGDHGDDKPSRKAKKIAPTPARKPPKVMTHKKDVRYMSVAKWHAVAPNPRQPRDQIVRAPKAKHLHKFIHNLHEEVYMAEDSKGNQWKLTAHTRGEVWFQGLSDVVPERVCVTVIPVKDAEEAGKLCLFYDSREAVNTSADLIHGALVYHGVPMTSPLLQKSAGLPTPLSYAYEIMLACFRQSPNANIRKHVESFAPVSRATAIDYVDAFKPDLAALDALQPGSKRGTTMLFRSPLLTAYLLAAKKYGAENVSPFFEKMQDGNCGMKNGKKRDPVGYTEWVLAQREGGARKEHFECVVRILAAIEVYMVDAHGDRDENGKSTYQPKVSIENLVGVDLDVYLTASNVRRTGRQNNRNSILKRKGSH